MTKRVWKIINGDLLVQNTLQLTSLQGLNYLEFVGGDVLLSNNEQLQSLDGLESLSRIDGDLLVGNITAGNAPTDWLGTS